MGIEGGSQATQLGFGDIGRTDLEDVSRHEVPETVEFRQGSEIRPSDSHAAFYKDWSLLGNLQAHRLDGDPKIHGLTGYQAESSAEAFQTGRGNKRWIQPGDTFGGRVADERVPQQ